MARLSARPFLLRNTPKVLLVALFGVSGLVSAPMLARAQGAAAPTPDNQQYRCLPDTSRCAYYQCDPTCRRSSAWETRDYNRGVDGDAPADGYSLNIPDSPPSSGAATGGYDRRYAGQTSQGYDQRYQSSQSSKSASGGGYDQSYQARNGYQAAPGGYGAGGYDERSDDDQVGASAPTAPGAGYGGGGYGGGGYSGNNYANAYGYSQGGADAGQAGSDQPGSDQNGQQGYDQQTYGQETYQNNPSRADQNGYGQPGYGQYGYSQPPVNPPADADDDDQGRDYAANAAPQPKPAYRYSGEAQYRCEGYRCAYFRCDPAGDDCHRISGWTSRADADRRPDYDGW